MKRDKLFRVRQGEGYSCRRFFAMAAATLISIGGVKAAVVTVNPISESLLINSGPSSADTFLNTAGAVRLGGSIYSGGPNQGEYSLLRFDLVSALPVGATITGATLKLTTEFDNSYSHNETLQIWQTASVNSGWVEGDPAETRVGATAGYLNQTSYTSPSVNDGTKWGGGGLFDIAPGNVDAGVGSLSLGTGPSANTTLSIDLDVNAVSAWLTDSSLENAGLTFHLTNDEVSAGDSRFFYVYSMDSGQSADRLPQLEITYTVPEPNTVALAISASIGLWYVRCLRRRRSA